MRTDRCPSLSTELRTMSVGLEPTLPHPCSLAKKTGSHWPFGAPRVTCATDEPGKEMRQPRTAQWMVNCIFIFISYLPALKYPLPFLILGRGTPSTWEQRTCICCRKCWTWGEGCRAPLTNQVPSLAPGLGQKSGSPQAMLVWSARLLGFAV